jgi:hypothetical protein
MNDPTLLSKPTSKAAVKRAPKVGTAIAEGEKDLYRFVDGFMNTEQIAAVKDWCKDGLGDDPTSSFFISRKKAIAFVLVFDNMVFSLEQSYFNQHQDYNDFSGGFRRHYSKIPDDFIQTHLLQSILRFKEFYGVPDKGIMLIQIQQSHIDAIHQAEASGPKSPLKKASSITGQGIHTDGHERAMIVCLERSNVKGALNSFFADLGGKTRLSEEKSLQEGQAVFFKDNSLFHYVSPATHEVPELPLDRTVMLMHYPAEDVLTGEKRSANNLGTRKSELKLRNSPRISGVASDSATGGVSASSTLRSEPSDTRRAVIPPSPRAVAAIAAASKGLVSENILWEKAQPIVAKAKVGRTMSRALEMDHS